MKKEFRIFIDISMTILLLILMGYYITENKIHETLGITLFVLFIAHNISNIKWYKSIFKGKHSFQRIFHVIINLLLLIAMFGMMISAIMITTNVSTIVLGRKLHMIFNSWIFILIAIHIGIHLNGIMTKINKKMKNYAFEYVYYFLIVIILGFGIYSFISSGLWEDMFLLKEYKFFDYEKNSITFYLEYLSIMFFISITTYSLLLLINKIKNRKERKI
ncbi:MAG: hypothetical protein Q4D02_06840 [Clostridia bacterium]|nr:hypothetical protein [Clostridia bacterium]